MDTNKTDREGHNAYYKSAVSPLINAGDYKQQFSSRWLQPFFAGGNTKGYVRSLSVQRLLEAAGERRDLVVLDAGCGLGELSTYLASLGFDVIGADISEEACRGAGQLAEATGVKCRFLAESLEQLSLPDESIDFIIGHGALHHFIKYEGVPAEFHRVMKPGAKGFFSDSFGENRAYHLFHDKEAMERLGDVILTRPLILDYFKDFDVDITPTDWFVMLDKLYMRVMNRATARRLSRVHFKIDRKIPINRVSLFLSGSVMTTITKRIAS